MKNNAKTCVVPKTSRGEGVSLLMIVAVWYTLGVVGLNVALADEPGEPPDPDPECTEVTHRHMKKIAAKLLSSTRACILTVGDSLNAGWLGNRHQVGIAKTFNHPNGIYSLTFTTHFQSNPFANRSNLASGYGVSNRPSVGEDWWLDGSFFGTVPIGDPRVYQIVSGTTPGVGDTYVRWTLQPDAFDTATVGDWFTRSNLSAQIAFLPDAGINYATGFSLDGGGAPVAFSTDDSNDVFGALRNQAVNMVNQKIPLDSSLALTVSSVTGTDDRWFAPVLLKVNNHDRPNGLALAGIGETSWAYARHTQDSQAGPGEKSYLHADLSRFIESVFDRDNEDHFVFVVHNGEGGSVSNQIATVNQMLDDIRDIYLDAGKSAPYFVLVSSWARRTHTHLPLVQAEVFWHVADERENTGMISLYGLTDGILLDGTDPAQAKWAAANGYDAIQRNADVLDASELNCVDSGSGVHQTTEGAFLFDYILWETIHSLAGEPGIPGDLNGDGVVDIDDLFILLAAWGECDDPDDCPADLDGNGVVDVDDLFILLANWG